MARLVVRMVVMRLDADIGEFLISISGLRFRMRNVRGRADRASMGVWGR